MAYRKSEHPRIVHLVQPRVLNFWDRSKMTRYHKKYLLLEAVRCGASKKGPPRDSTRSTARGGQLLAMCRRLRLITTNLLDDNATIYLSITISEWKCRSTLPLNLDAALVDAVSYQECLNSLSTLLRDLLVVLLSTC